MGAILVTIGVITVTGAEGIQKSTVYLAECNDCSGLGVLKSGIGQRSRESLDGDVATWLVGVLMLLVALLLSSLLGHIQEWSYRNYGTNWREGLFYTHLLGLPYFILLWNDISNHMYIASNSSPFVFGNIFAFLPVLPVPKLWMYLFLNVATQLVCIYGVFMLTGAAGTLTCTMTLTIRKFISLIISIMYFNNPFTAYHWMGSALVFLGSLYYVWGKDKTPKTKKE